MFIIESQRHGSNYGGTKGRCGAARASLKVCNDSFRGQKNSPLLCIGLAVFNFSYIEVPQIKKYKYVTNVFIYLLIFHFPNICPHYLTKLLPTNY